MAGRTPKGARATLVLAKRYLADVVRNPALLVSCLVPLVLALMLWFMMAENFETLEDGRMFATAMFSYAVLFESIMVTTMVVVYAMAEEREKHFLHTLLLAGVPRGQITLAHGLTAVVVMTAAAILSALAVGASSVNTLLVGLVAMLAALPLMLASLTVGLLTKNQMSAMTLDTPFVIVGIFPLFNLTSEGMAAITPYLPTGGLYLLTQLALEGRLFTPDAVLPAASTLVWIVIAAAALAFVVKRTPQEA